MAGGMYDVQMGMVLKVWISPGQRDDALYVQEDSPLDRSERGRCSMQVSSLTRMLLQMSGAVLIILFLESYIR